MTKNKKKGLGEEGWRGKGEGKGEGKGKGMGRLNWKGFMHAWV